MPETFTYEPLDLERLGPVDWERLAFPQDDQYDTGVFERICEQRYGWQLWDVPAGTPTWLGNRLGSGGRVQIRKCDPSPWGDKGYVEVPPGDARWTWAAELAASWPAQHLQFQRLINYVGSDAPRHVSFGNGCSCGPPGGNPFHMSVPIEPERWGNVYCTMHSGSGFCEGVCHELAHWKGYALGIYIEDWEHLIFANEPPRQEWIDGAPKRDASEEEHALWVSRGLGIQPFRPDRMRPLGACFQEIWNCIHMIAYHLHMLPLFEREGGFPGEPPLNTFLKWARFHVERSLRGHRDMLVIARPTPVIGERFWQGYCSWVDRLLDEAKRTYGELDHV